MIGRLKTRWPWLAAALFALVVLASSRGFTLDTWDGIQALENSVLLARAAELPRFGGLAYVRPPIGSLLAAPFVGWSHRGAGPLAAMRLFQSLMVVAAALGIVLCHRLNARLVSPRAAALALVAMIVNPMLIQFSPFIVLDLLGPFALVLFLWAACRYDEAPTSKGFLALSLAYLLAVLTKYQLCALIGAPLLFPLVDPRRRGAGWPARARRFVLNPVWLLPGLCWLALPLLWSAAAILLGARNPGSILPQVRAAMTDRLAENVGVKASGALAMLDQPSPFFYAQVLAYQLGWPLLAVAGLGAASWFRDRDAVKRHAALALACVLGFLVFLIYRPYPHYAFVALPLVYGALAQGLEELWRRRLKSRRAQAAALAAFAVVLPWSRAAAGIDFLRRDPPLRSTIPWKLAAAVEAATRPGECVGWRPGDIQFPLSELRYEPQPLMIGAPIFAYFTSRRVVELPEEEELGPACEMTLLVVPRGRLQGARLPPRWDGDAVARLYREPSGELVGEVKP